SKNSQKKFLGERTGEVGLPRSPRSLSQTPKNVGSGKKMAFELGQSQGHRESVSIAGGGRRSSPRRLSREGTLIVTGGPIA
ncbi:MAG: hypothetical protein WD049_04515, partial [Candidatus Paceibacterota bacterium]